MSPRFQQTLECRQFGQGKCAYIYVERGKRKSLGESLTLNNIVIKELNEGDRCTYLRIDESAGMDKSFQKKKYERNTCEE